MKTKLLFFLLLPLWVAGQTKVDTTSQFHCPDLAKKLDSSRIAYTSYFSMDRAIDSRLSELLTEYEKDCYNDSAKQEMLIFDVWDGSKFYRLLKPRNEKYIPMESNFIKDTIYYTHKEPFNPFTDFIKWLKTKQN